MNKYYKHKYRSSPTVTLSFLYQYQAKCTLLLVAQIKFNFLRSSQMVMEALKSCQKGLFSYHDFLNKTFVPLDFCTSSWILLKYYDLHTSLRNLRNFQYLVYFRLKRKISLKFNKKPKRDVLDDDEDDDDLIYENLVKAKNVDDAQVSGHLSRGLGSSLPGSNDVFLKKMP